MTSTRLPRGVAAVRAAAVPLDGTDADLDALLDLVGDAHFVLLGEASHGTHEFYATRVAITRRLVAERGFDAVAVEGDWPDSDRVNRYVRHRSSDANASEALGGFRRFPQWMWRNEDVVQLVEWLRTHNATAAQAPVGFYGIDLYSLHSSIDEVLRYLERVDPDAAKRARYRYRCFEHFGEDPQAYGYAASFDLARSCEDEVVEQLVELQRRAPDLASRSAADAADEFFSAEQNARLVANAEEYYRSMFRGRVSSWNLRDTHMTDTVDALAEHLQRQGRAGKIVVWAHNSHLGDARATEMGAGGEVNVGQLVRQRHGDDARLIGFSTHAGTVTAADDWGDPARRMRVRPSLPGSVERLMHDVGIERFFLPLRGSEAAHAAAEVMREPMLERAIGVIYRPDTERQSHYFHARVGEQFDAMFHFDETSAVVPLERRGKWSPADGDEPPETFPSGL
jgi:erythromycin esterase-like protein